MTEEARRPYDHLRVLARQEVRVTSTLRHVEIYTLDGLLTLLWHGDPTAERVALMCGGAMGGVLGPAHGLFHDLGVALAERGLGAVRVSYRQPNVLPACVLDTAAAADLAARTGAERFVAIGHSFGGAVAVQVACLLANEVAGVATLATQSAGCEMAGRLAGRPLLLFHGDGDEILPVEASATVQAIAGHGELVVLPGTGHLMAEAGDLLRERLLEWVLEVLPA